MTKQAMLDTLDKAYDEIMSRNKANSLYNLYEKKYKKLGENEYMCDIEFIRAYSISKAYYFIKDNEPVESLYEYDISTSAKALNNPSFQKAMLNETINILLSLGAVDYDDIQEGECF